MTEDCSSSDSEVILQKREQVRTNQPTLKSHSGLGNRRQPEEVQSRVNNTDTHKFNKFPFNYEDEEETKGQLSLGSDLEAPKMMHIKHSEMPKLKTLSKHEQNKPQSTTLDTLL